MPLIRLAPLLRAPNRQSQPKHTAFQRTSRSLVTRPRVTFGPYSILLNRLSGGNSMYLELKRQMKVRATTLESIDRLYRVWNEN